MTKVLPGLGSGALREGDEVWVRGKVVGAIPGVTTVEFPGSDHYVYCREGQAVPALSLSSPIEPERCPTCTSSVRNIKTGLAYGVLEPGKCPNIWHHEAQASSEIREARVAAFNEAIDAINGVRFAFERSGWADALERVIKLRNAALAPSRQEAGSK